MNEQEEVVGKEWDDVLWRCRGNWKSQNSAFMFKNVCY